MAQNTEKNRWLDGHQSHSIRFGEEEVCSPCRRWNPGSTNPLIYIQSHNSRMFPWSCLVYCQNLLGITEKTARKSLSPRGIFFLSTEFIPRRRIFRYIPCSDADCLSPTLIHYPKEKVTLVLRPKQCK